MAKQIFEGIKVADFAWVGAGPQVGRELAVHGATVIRVENHRVPDSLRAFGPFKDGIPHVDRSVFGACYHTNKYSVAIDISKPRGLEMAKKLVAWADIVSDSFTPGTMAKFGLDYESCKKIKEDIIYFSTCQMGQQGPLRKFGGYGMFGTTYAGFCNLLGLPDREPLPIWNNYTDFISPWYMTSTLVAALIRRKKTGKGIYLDQSQVEAGVTFLGPAVLDYVANGRIATRMGNRDKYMAPHGIYPCQGTDRWLALAVRSNEEWQALCRVMGEPMWTRDVKFATFLARKENEDELDANIAAWTRDYPREHLMATLQAAGISAGIVESAEDLFNDPQLKHRRHYRILEHKAIGPHAYNSPAYHFSKTPCDIKKAAPCLGEDTEWIYKEILGQTDDDIADLIVEGVITTEADLPGAL